MHAIFLAGYRITDLGLWPSATREAATLLVASSSFSSPSFAPKLWEIFSETKWQKNYSLGHKISFPFLSRLTGQQIAAQQRKQQEMAEGWGEHHEAPSVSSHPPSGQGSCNTATFTTSKTRAAFISLLSSAQHRMTKKRAALLQEKPKEQVKRVGSHMRAAQL